MQRISDCPGSRLEQYCNDLNFRAGNTNMAIRHSAAGGNTYMYFMKKPVTTRELGVIHAAEIPYLFDNPMEDPMGSGEIVSNEECEFRHVIKPGGLCYETDNYSRQHRYNG